MLKIIVTAIFLYSSFSVIANQLPSNIDQAMYFKSRVADASQCKDAFEVKNNKISFKNVSNPALTCPDSFAWKQFLEAVKSEFWTNWSTDQQIWVEEPKAFCSTKSQKDCCELNKKSGKVTYRGTSSSSNYNCPLYPGSDKKTKIKLTRFSDKQKLSPHAKNQSEPLEDISRIGRDTEAEIVYHNKSFFNYSIANDLYHTNGLANIFKAKQFEAEKQAPFRTTGQGVNYPDDAVMFKVDFISESIMEKLGYINDHDNNSTTAKNNKEHPYITMMIEDPKTKKTTRHYLVAVTGASKALPNWHWYAFEHVNNIGRCDYLGCNDSFGFSHKVYVNMPNEEQSLVDTHFIPPHQTTTKLGDNLFKRNEIYTSANMTSQLKRGFKKMGIGQKKHKESSKRHPQPTVTDKAWQSYRLKGSQVSYYHNDGSPVLMGASITEGGFVNSSSCMSCHVQAAVDLNGGVNGPVGGTMDLSLQGLNKVTNGAPERSVFYQTGSTTVNAARIDFVWGILNANPLSEK